MSKPKFSKRLTCALLNFFIFFFLAITLDYFLMPKTYKAAFHYEDINVEITDKTKEFADLQDRYGIYVYDENNNRIENKDISQEQADAFLNDPRVAELKVEVPDLQAKIIKIDVSSFVICYVVSCLGINIAFSYILGKGNSFGGLIMGVRYKTIDGENINGKTVIFYDLLSFAFHYVLSLLTIFILPAFFLYQIYYDEKSQSSIEKWLHIQYFDK